MSDEKLYTPPQDKSAAYIVVSMAKKDSIEYCLNHFPQAPPEGKYSDYKEEKTTIDDVSKKGISTTFLWSGNKGSNVPVNLFSKGDEMIGGIGFVLEHSKLHVPR